ncbi:MAG: DUF4465 domain-containing protein [Bacteroidia bacterium]|nr:DUF4465 domain-containing protein [Bacteroidia bacterium]
MKNIKNHFIAIVLGLLVFTACQKEDRDLVETKTVDFESLTLGSTSFWNGSDGTGEFNASGIKFKNNYNAMYGSWDGFVYSQKADITTSGYINQYSVFDGTNATNKFALYYPPFGADAFALFPTGSEYNIKSISVCNSTYTALSMKNGDASFSKKFGGTTGNDKDWFKMTVIGFNAVGDSVKSVDFFLADYRFDDNSKDYIVNKWTTVDLASLGKINKITFRLTSTDNGAWGMNTPAYVCLDNIKYEVVTPK